jgi:hypothetical protein
MQIILIKEKNMQFAERQRQHELEQDQKRKKRIRSERPELTENQIIFELSTFVPGEWTPIQPQDGDQWGPWTFNAHALTLEYREKPYSFSPYWIDLEELGSSRDVLDWLAHLAGKIWGNAETIGFLVLALRDISEIRYWGDATLNLTEAIYRRYGRGVVKQEHANAN